MTRKNDTEPVERIETLSTDEIARNNKVFTKPLVRDKRRVRFFMLDNEIIDDYAEEVGAAGIGVYAALVRYSRGSEARITIAKLSKKLRMGKATLLKKLGELEASSLIEIERGDEITCSAYTILDVKQYEEDEGESGSKIAESGSKQNRSGSKQNPINTLGLNTKEKKAAPATDRLDTRGWQTLSTLTGSKNWKKNEEKTAELILGAMEAYPAVDLLALSKDFKFKTDTGVYSYRDPAKAFVNWTSNQQARNGSGSNGAGERDARGDSPAVQDLRRMEAETKRIFGED